MVDDSCTTFCMARKDRTITSNVTSSIFPYIITSLALLFFLLVLMAHHDDHHQQENPSLFIQSDASNGANFKRQSTSEASTRRDCRDNNPTKASNAFHFSPIGRKGGRHFSWRDEVFNTSAHEVPSGPNPISNR